MPDKERLTKILHNWSSLTKEGVAAASANVEI